MPLSASSPEIYHVLQNASLICVALIFAPLLSIFTLLCSLFIYGQTLLSTTEALPVRRDGSTKYTVLVTGVGMSKGLVLARSFHCAGHRVIGADFEPYCIPVCGRFSRAIHKFYRLHKPTSKSSQNVYVQDLVRVIESEHVDLWISCSGVASAVEDGLAKEAVERMTSCKAIQFDAEMTELLHDKGSFIKNTARLCLNVPATHLVTSVDEGMSVLSDGLLKVSGKKFIMKSVGMDDSIRSDPTLLPRQTSEATQKHLQNLGPSLKRPFVLQQFISGGEYCTHSLCIRGRVRAFTACKSSDLLMHYTSISSTSPMFLAMERYTQIYAEKMGKSFTGHFSIDFMVLEEDESIEDPEVLTTRLYPIECNPRAHTANVLFGCNRIESAELVSRYLEVLQNESKNGNAPNIVVHPGQDTKSMYWIGHDVVVLGLLPVLHLLTGRASIMQMFEAWRMLFVHIWFWKDGTFELWDPWPFWALYVIYWPAIFMMSIAKGLWWSRCNVSTCKIFRC